MPLGRKQVPGTPITQYDGRPVPRSFTIKVDAELHPNARNNCPCNAGDPSQVFIDVPQWLIPKDFYKPPHIFC